MNLRHITKVLAVFATLAAPQLAPAQDLILEKRFILFPDTDYAGGDIASIFDTTRDACMRACAANSACEAFTFNTRNGACFAKAGGYEAADYAGAVSGQMLLAEAGANARAAQRRSELAFMQDWDVSAAVQQAGDLSVQVLAGDYLGYGALASDRADDWADYASAMLAAGRQDQNNARAYYERAQHAATNAYLRAENPAQRHTILVTLSMALESVDRGRDMVKALRLAQALQPRDDTALMLEDASGKYGFRIVETLVQSDLARPRICAVFSEELDPNITDFTPFVTARDTAISVGADGSSQICAEGLAHGARYALTFRAGLPAKDGQSLTKPVDITAYIRDRSPSVRFAGRGYVLPRGGEAALPVQTVNTQSLDLTLYRMTDRNLIRALQNGFLSAPLADYQEYDFTQQIGAKLWQGSAEVSQDVNKDITTRLPIAEALATQTAGVYALRASVPGVDPYVSPAAWQWFVVSDIGLTTLSGVDGLHVFARSLGDASPLAGVEVQLVSQSNDVLGSITTDDQGYARFDAGLTRGAGAMSAAMIVARSGADDMAFLSLKDGAFDLSDRGVAGRPAAPPIDVFLATDRGAYRAGETVNLTALARDSANMAVDGLPLTAVFKRPDGVEYARYMSNASDAGQAGAGGHVFALPIAGSAPRGQWRIDVFADPDAPALASTTVLVEDFLPERIDFTLLAKETPLRLGDAAQISVDARYLFGAPAADLAIEGEIILSQSAGIAAWQGYQFGRHDRVFSTRLEPFSGLKTGADGRVDLSLALPQVDDPARPLDMIAVLRIADGSARPVERKLTKPITPNTPMIGLKPLFENAAPEGGEARFSVIALGADTAPVQTALTWVLTRLETDYQWYQYGGNWNWEPVTTRSKIAEGLINSDMAAEIAAPVTWGEYELAVQAVDGSAAASLTFAAGWNGGADVTQTPDMLELSLDAKTYHAGDVAKLRVVPRAPGTALVQVMSNRLIHMRAVAVNAGENIIELPVTGDWGTGAYVAVSALRPLADSRIPIRALGIAHASIDPADHALVTTIETAKQADPRGPLDIAVKVDGVLAGETAYVTIAAVDEGILNLTGHQPPDPFGHYFSQRKLGMDIRDLYGRLIDSASGAMGSVRSGGDAGANARLQAPPPTEELLAFFSGPVKVGADGYARTTFALPAFNGSVKVMALAWSKTGVGQASADVLVRDPVVVAAALPRFMALGDRSRLALDITHATGPAGNMGLKVMANGLVLGDAPQQIRLDEKATQRIEIPIAADTVGVQTITVALTTPAGKILTKTLTLPVQINDAPIVRNSRFDLASGSSFTADQNMFDGLMSGTATVSIGPMARLNAAGILTALSGYPYGCTEQITSKALPLLYLSSLGETLGVAAPADLPAKIDAALKGVLVTQNGNGAFGLWRAGDGGDMWLDAYVTDFLGRSRAQGFTVPDPAFRSALDNLRNQVNYYPDFDYGGEGLAYALMVLAREGAAAIGDLRYYADVKGDAFATPAAMAQLGAALALYGDQPRADAMFARAGAALDALSQDAPEQIFRADFGSSQRDAAVVLALALESGSNVVDRDALLRRLATQRALSTQESAWTLVAAANLSGLGSASGISVNGAPTNSTILRLTDTDLPIEISNSGADTVLTVTAIGTPLGPEAAGGAGYAITRSYLGLDGTPVDMDALTVGQRMAVVLDITPFGRGEARLMVNDPLPAGFEIDTPSLISSSLDALAGLDLLQDTANSEFRQDRFLAAIDRMDNQPFRLGYIVRAISPGDFHHPAAVIEDMYRPDFSARSETGRVTIAP